MTNIDRAFLIAEKAHSNQQYDIYMTCQRKHISL